MNDDIIKKKTELMKSIMMNPKLSRTFKDAMSAPIGSTKREHVKSILSIMKKVGGLKNDGMGGPIPMGMPPAPAPMPETPNYGNMIIFPAAPKLKAKAQPAAPTPQKVKSSNSFDGSGGPYDGKGGILDNFNLNNFSINSLANSLTTNPFAPSPSTAYLIWVVS